MIKTNRRIEEEQQNDPKRVKFKFLEKLPQNLAAVLTPNSMNFDFTLNSSRNKFAEKVAVSRRLLTC